MSVLFYARPKCNLMGLKRHFWSRVIPINLLISFYNTRIDLAKNYFRHCNNNCTFRIKVLLFYNTFFFFTTFFCINRRKYWFQENFRHLVFDRFTCFGMSWTRFEFFWKMSVCVWQKFCGKCSSRTNAQNFMKFYI